jgi:hypothetical protein
MDGAVEIDRRAAGFGWFVDSTPLRDEEFAAHGNELAVPGLRGIDLLTVVLHELGHVAGYDHDEAGDDGLMEPALAPGVRRVPVVLADTAAIAELPVAPAAAAPLVVRAWISAGPLLARIEVHPALRQVSSAGAASGYSPVTARRGSRDADFST